MKAYTIKVHHRDFVEKIGFKSQKKCDQSFDNFIFQMKVNQNYYRIEKYSGKSLIESVGRVTF